MISFVRRVALALGVAGAFAAIFRVRGQGGVPPSTGGWKPVSLEELDE